MAFTRTYVKTTIVTAFSNWLVLGPSLRGLEISRSVAPLGGWPALGAAAASQRARDQREAGMLLHGEQRRRGGRRLSDSISSRGHDNRGHHRDFP